MYALNRQNSFWDQPILSIINRGTHNTQKRQVYLKIKPTCGNRKVKISLIGIDKICDTKNPWWVRCIWFVCLVTLISLCCWQLSKTLCTYLSCPTIKQTDVVRSDIVHFPAVQICPGFLRDMQFVMQHPDRPMCNDSTLSCWMTDPFEKHFFSNFPPLIGSNDSVTRELIFRLMPEISLYTMCSKGNENCTNDGVKWKGNFKFIATAAGVCTLFDTAQILPFHGQQTFLKIILHSKMHTFVFDFLKSELNNATSNYNKESLQESIERLRVGAVISVQSSFALNLKHTYLHGSKDMYMGHNTHILLRQKQFELLNKSKNYCEDEVTVQQCIDKCIEKNLSTTCSPLHYIVKSKKNCTWSLDYIQLEVKNFKVYNQLNLSHCGCPNICNEVSYTLFPNVIAKIKNDSSLSVKIYFADNNIEMTSERYSYNFTAWLSDFGGHLGFFLGFCLLTIIEMVEYGIVKLIKREKQ